MIAEFCWKTALNLNLWCAWAIFICFIVSGDLLCSFCCCCCLKYRMHLAGWYTRDKTEGNGKTQKIHNDCIISHEEKDYNRRINGKFPFSFVVLLFHAIIKSGVEMRNREKSHPSSQWPSFVFVCRLKAHGMTYTSIRIYELKRMY